MGFLSSIFSVFGVIKELLSLIRSFMDMVDKTRQVESEKKRQELEKALDDAKKATTPEEAFDAQDRITRNSN